MGKSKMTFTLKDSIVLVLSQITQLVRDRIHVSELITLCLVLMLRMLAIEEG